MISVYNIKPKFQKLLSPILQFMYKLGITANQITISSIILSIIISILFWNASSYNIFWLSLPIGLLIRMALNALDGMMARTYNQQSKLGEVLNEIGDIVSDIFIFFPLLKYENHQIYVIIIFICLSIINEFAGIMGRVISNNRRYDGPMGKSDRAFIIGLYGLINFLGFYFVNFSVYIFVIINILLIISTLLRLKRSLKNEKNI